MTTTDTMRTSRSVRLGATGLLALLATGVVVSLMLDRGTGVAVASTDTAAVEPVSTETTPATTVAPTTPASAPPATQPATAPPSGPSITSAPVDGEGGEITPITWIAVLATAALLALAVWWMLRRPEDNEAPANPHDSDWPTSTDVI